MRCCRKAIVLPAIFALAGCDLVLGIDELNSAMGPDGGQKISAATADPGTDAAAEDDGGTNPRHAADGG